MHTHSFITVYAWGFNCLVYVAQNAIAPLVFFQIKAAFFKKEEKNFIATNKNVGYAYSYQWFFPPNNFLSYL